MGREPDCFVFRMSVGQEVKTINEDFFFKEQKEDLSQKGIWVKTDFPPKIEMAEAVVNKDKKEPILLTFFFPKNTNTQTEFLTSGSLD